MERRNCCQVITDMLSKIPADETALIQDLHWNFIDASYKAPEGNIQWERTQLTLMKYIPVPMEDWEFEVLSIFTTHPIDSIKIAVADMER